jgi:hypothetical protein
VRKIFDIVHMINLIYIAFLVPFSVAFSRKLNQSNFIAYESISVSVQLLTILVQLRTPIIQFGTQTLDFMLVVKHYLSNGLIPDLFGLLPINLFFTY